MQVDLTETQMLMLRSALATKRKSLARRQPDPQKMGALSTHMIETVAVKELDDKLAVVVAENAGLRDEKSTR